MKKKLFSALILGLILSACTANSNGKPLVGGIKESAETQVEASDEKAVAEESTDNYEAVEGLEIPAKLTAQPEQILKRAGYTVSYNSNTRLPNWVAWHLTAEHLKGNTSRKEKSFQEDEDVKTPRATDSDYFRSGYDRGHMCPAGDNKWSDEAMTQSFLFTNICPQVPNLNRGDWNEMENMCRKWAKQYGDIYIVCGPIIYKKKTPTKIGKNKVVVPDAFFKVVLCMKGTPKAIGFIYKNAEGDRPKGDYMNTVDEVERITGFDFFPTLPDDVEKKVEAESKASDWGI